MLSQSRPRLAWFSPVPPARSGIAGRSAELVVELRAAFDIDVFVDEPVARATTDPRVRSAHEFVFFLVILLVAYVYVWRKGALEWQ